MKGYRTLLTGAALTVVPPLLQYGVGIDWASIIPPPWGTVVAGVLMIALRLMTNTAAGKKW